MYVPHQSSKIKAMCLKAVLGALIIVQIMIRIMIYVVGTSCPMNSTYSSSIRMVLMDSICQRDVSNLSQTAKLPKGIISKGIKRRRTTNRRIEVLIGKRIVTDEQGGEAAPFVPIFEVKLCVTLGTAK